MQVVAVEVPKVKRLAQVALVAEEREAIIHQQPQVLEPLLMELQILVAVAVAWRLVLAILAQVVLA